MATNGVGVGVRPFLDLHLSGPACPHARMDCSSPTIREAEVMNDRPDVSQAL